MGAGGAIGQVVGIGPEHGKVPREASNKLAIDAAFYACGNEEDIFGAIMSGECIHNLGTELFSMNGEFKGEAQSNICRFGRNVLALANRTKDNFGIIYRYDTHDVCDTVSEELIHWKQELYNQRYADGYVNLASVADHLHWPVIHKALIDTYHPENLNNLVNEAGAKVALGKSAEVGLTPEEGREFLRFYCHLIIQMHGSAVATDILQYATKLKNSSFKLNPFNAVGSNSCAARRSLHHVNPLPKFGHPTVEISPHEGYLPRGDGLRNCSSGGLRTELWFGASFRRRSERLVASSAASRKRAIPERAARRRGITNSLP